MSKKSIGPALRALIAWPIFFYLLHWILIQLHAGDLQMFLFWVYAPVTVLASVMISAATKE